MKVWDAFTSISADFGGFWDLSRHQSLNLCSEQRQRWKCTQWGLRGTGYIIALRMVHTAEDKDGLRAPPQLAQGGLGEDGLGAQPREGVVQVVHGGDGRQFPLQLVQHKQLPVLK